MSPQQSLRPVVKLIKEEPLSWKGSCLRVQLGIWRTERYFAGRLTEVGNGSAKRKGRIKRQFSLNPIEGFLKTNVSKLFSTCDFFFVEEFAVILRNSWNC